MTGEAILRGWRSANDWKRLSPYPSLREVSPTDSVGVWIERRRGADGEVQMWRVSAEQTQGVTLSDGCAVSYQLHHRTFDTSVAVQFTDARLRELVKANTRGMIYVWSRGMPLSVLGIAAARDAAAALGADFTLVSADDEPTAPDASNTPGAARLFLASIELVYRNATLHFPSVVFYENGNILGSALPGYRTKSEYESLGRDVFLQATARLSLTPAVPPIWLDQAAKIQTESIVAVPRHIGFFFKPVGRLPIVSYVSGEHAFLFDYSANKELRIPGSVDPVPTPDGRIITRPGLRFHDLPSLLRGDTVPVFVDASLPDEYQTASVLRQSRGESVYRVITGWRSGVRSRDYIAHYDSAATLQWMRPASRVYVPCSSFRLSLPISAKTGRDLGAFDTRSSTTKLFRVSADEACSVERDLAFPTGKLAFSYSGELVAFSTSRINLEAEGRLLKRSELFYADAFLLSRKSGRLVALSHNRGVSGKTFPEFLPDGRLIVLDQPTGEMTHDTFRILRVR
jgi:hypothetical protein